MNKVSNVIDKGMPGIGHILGEGSINTNKIYWFYIIGTMENMVATPVKVLSGVMNQLQRVTRC